MVTDTSTSDPGLNALAVGLATQFEPLGCEVHRGFGELTLVVPQGQLLAVCASLRDEEAFRFDLLMDLCGVDYAAFGRSEWQTSEASEFGFGRGVDRDPDLALDDPRRFAVVYHLLSLVHNHRVRLRVYATGVQPMVDSVETVWASANWFEREAFDLYGILFRGHPDLRRILTDYGFIGHPFRKDFPLSGHVEMRYDPAQGRVIYEPVAIDPRVLVPKVIREQAPTPGHRAADVQGAVKNA